MSAAFAELLPTKSYESIGESETLLAPGLGATCRHGQTITLTAPAEERAVGLSLFCRVSVKQTAQMALLSAVKSAERLAAR